MFTGLNSKMAIYLAMLSGVPVKAAAATLAQATLSQKIALCTSMLWEQTKAWLATPIGMISAIALGIFAVVKVTDALTVSASEANEKLEKTAQEVADLHSEQESLNNELETTRQRIAELKAQGTLTFTEEAELTRLQKENAELERKLELTKANKAASKSEFEEDFLDAFDKNYGDKSTFNYQGRRNWLDKLADALLEGSETRFTAEEYTNDLFASYEKALSGDKAYEHNLDKYKERINDVYEDYQGYLKQLEDANYSYGTNEQIDAYIDQINEFNDKYLIAFGNTENLFAQIVSRDKFADGYAAIKELGNVTQETLSQLYNENEKVRELINYLMGLGTVDWKTILGDDKFTELDTNADGTLTTLELFDQTTGECKVTSEQFSQAMSGVANELNKVEEAAEEAANSTLSLSKAYDELKESVEPLSKAYDEMTKNGSLSADTLLSLLDKYPELVSRIEVENGLYKINRNLLKEQFELEKQKRIAQLEGAKKSIGYTKKEIESEIQLARAKLMSAEADSSDMTAFVNWKIKLNELEKYTKAITVFKNLNFSDFSDSSSQKSPEEKRREAAEKYFDELKYRLETNQITEEQYLKKLDAAYKKYYGDKSKYLEEYAEYSQEVYEGFKDMYKEDLEAQKDAWEEKKDAVSEYYDKLREEIKNTHDEEDYEKEQSEKRKEIFDLDMQIAELMRDGSEKAKARIAALEEERLKAEEELLDFETDKAREDELSRLEKEQKAEEDKIQQQIDGIQGQLDKLDEDTISVRNAIIAYAKEKGVTLDFAYASGTRSSVGGFGRINEKGIEMISAPDGNGNYIPMLPNSYVFSAKATEFLWKLATEHSLPQAMYNSIAKSIKTQSSTPSVNIAQPITITMGDVIIKGNADKQTVADIKKQQENTVRMVLQKIKELQK